MGITKVVMVMAVEVMDREQVVEMNSLSTGSPFPRLHQLKVVLFAPTKIKVNML